MPFATTDDGVKIHYEILGNPDGPVLFMGYPWCEGLGVTIGMPTTSNQAWLEAFADRYRIVNFAYPRGVPPTELGDPAAYTADRVAADYLTVADEVGVDRFVTMGWSAGGHFGLQVATRTARVAGVVCGCHPPLGGSYQGSLERFKGAVASGTARGPWGGTISTSSGFFEGMISYFESIVQGGRDEDDEVRKLGGARITFVGSEDQGGAPDGKSGGLADLVRKNKDDLERLGWEVLIFDGLDHMGALERVDVVIPAIRAALDKHTW